MTEASPKDQGTEEGGPRSTWEPGFSVGHGVALGAAGATQVCLAVGPRAEVLRTARGPGSRVAALGGVGWRGRGSRLLTRPPHQSGIRYGHPETAHLRVGREGTGVFRHGPRQRPRPQVRPKKRARAGARGSEGDLHRGLTSLLTARYSKAWLIQRTAGVFSLTHFHQTTQWITDSERIKQSV